MSALKIFTAIGIHLVVPLLGIALYFLLCRKMWRAQIPSPPFFSYFVIFAIMVSWLLVLLTVLFWEWSGMASIGFLLLFSVAPLATAVLGVSLFHKRAFSVFHHWAFVAAAMYTGVIGLAVLGWIGFF